MICRTCGLEFSNALTHCPRCGSSAIPTQNHKHSCETKPLNPQDINRRVNYGQYPLGGTNHSNHSTNHPTRTNSTNTMYNSYLLENSVKSKNHQWYSASIADCKIETRINLVAVFAVIMFGFFAYETISWLINPPSAYTGGFVGTYFLLGMWVVFTLYFMAHIIIKYRIVPCPNCNTPHNIALNSVGFVCSACGKQIAIIDGKIRKAEEIE